MMLDSKNFGPASYANWKAFDQKEKLKAIVEFPIFTDARITGEAIEGYGPYKFLNAVPVDNRPGLLKPSIVLRAEYYLDNDLPPMKETDTSNYHGGWYPDEIAALTSLCLGIRAKAGSASRRFDNDDQLGRPQAYSSQSEPSMSLGKRLLVLPNVVGAHSLNKLDALKLLPRLSCDEAIGVIRAARLYQDALWISESEPSLSWVMLVSAIEAGANIWDKGDDSPVSKLKKSKPELYDFLINSGGNEVAERVSDEIVHTLGATNKFVKFILEFLPEPPEVRPPEWAQVKWSRKSMRAALSKIYEYRSNALHGGVPFPAPMCAGDMIGDDCMAEKPTGQAYATLGAVWMAEDTPMLLHVFEHIGRGALINWLNSMQSND